MTILERDGKVKVIAETRTPEGTVRLFGGPMPAASLYSPIEFVKKNPNTVQALTNAMVRALMWMQEASPQQILETVPEEYMLGNKAMYLFAYNNVKTAYSKDGLFSEAGAKTTLKALASSNPKLKPEQIKLARRTPTSSSRRRSPSTARRSSAMPAAVPALALEHITVTFVSQDAARYTAVRDTTLRVRPGEFVSVVGPTGCGKSTLLNIAAGLLAAFGGQRARLRRAAAGPQPQGRISVPERGAAALAHRAART